MKCLNAAAQLIDASLTAEPTSSPPRLRALHYPAALDWIRIEDVLRLAVELGQPVSKRALINRWATKDDFVRDAVIHAMLYRDDPAGDPTQEISSLEAISSAASFSSGVAAVIDSLVGTLLDHPRSFLLAHIAPLLGRHPELSTDIRRSSEESQAAWSETYGRLLVDMKLQLRRDWTRERLTLAIQLVLDGTVLRVRVQREPVLQQRWTAGSLYADTVLAIISGALDLEADDLPMREWLDGRVRAASKPSEANQGSEGRTGGTPED